MLQFGRVLLSAYYWSKATYLAAHEKYNESLSYVSKSEKLRKDNTEQLLLKGFLYYALKNHKTSEMTLNEAILKIKNSPNFNNDTKSYLINYAYEILNSIQNSVVFSYLGIKDIDNVPEHLRERYPKRWEEVKF